MWNKLPTPVKGVLTHCIVGALVIAVGLIYLRFAPDSLRPWTNSPQPATQPKDPAAKVERVEVPGPVRVKVIEKIKYVDRFPDVLTPSTVQDNSAQVIASATIPPSPAGGTASAILRTGPDGVGVGSIEYRAAKPRFLQVKKSFGAEGWYYPVGDRQAEASLVANPLRIGPIEVKVKVGAAVMRDNSQIRGFVAVGGEWQF
jgi:hypothetical protein